jgi:hypothetical protein
MTTRNLYKRTAYISGQLLRECEKLFGACPLVVWFVSACVSEQCPLVCLLIYKLFIEPSYKTLL